MNNLYNVKSSEFIDFLNLNYTLLMHTTTQANFCFSDCTITFSEVSLPTLAKILFATRVVIPIFGIGEAILFIFGAGL